MTCNDCIHSEVCKKTRIMNPSHNYAAECNDYNDRSRFVELPCKLGDEIFCTTVSRIYQGIVGRIELDDEGFAIITTDGYCVDSTICYHTQEEAEQALKEREENETDD